MMRASMLSIHPAEVPGEARPRPRPRRPSRAPWQARRRTAKSAPRRRCGPECHAPGRRPPSRNPLLPGPERRPGSGGARLEVGGRIGPCPVARAIRGAQMASSAMNTMHHHRDDGHPVVPESFPNTSRPGLRPSIGPLIVPGRSGLGLGCRYDRQAHARFRHESLHLHRDGVFSSASLSPGWNGEMAGGSVLPGRPPPSPRALAPRLSRSAGPWDSGCGSGSPTAD